MAFARPCGHYTFCFLFLQNNCSPALWTRRVPNVELLFLSLSISLSGAGMFAMLLISECFESTHHVTATKWCLLFVIHFLSLTSASLFANLSSFLPLHLFSFHFLLLWFLFPSSSANSPCKSLISLSLSSLWVLDFTPRSWGQCHISTTKRRGDYLLMLKGFSRRSPSLLKSLHSVPPFRLFLRFPFFPIASKQKRTLPP